MKQQSQKIQKHATNWFSKLALIWKIIIVVVVIYILYSVIATIFSLLDPFLKALRKLFGPGGPDPAATKAPWWVWVGIAWYCGFFGLAKAGMSKLSQTISFHTGKNIKEMAKEFNVTEENLRDFLKDKKAQDPNYKEERLWIDFQKERIYEPYIKQLKEKYDSIDKTTQQGQEQAARVKQEETDAHTAQQDDESEFYDAESGE